MGALIFFHQAGETLVTPRGARATTCPTPSATWPTAR